MDRVFLDANILFSAAYGLSSLDRLWGLSKEGKCVLIASNYVIEEARRNLAYKSQISRLESYSAEMQIVPEADPSLKCPLKLPDNDKPVLMAAVSAKADYLLTGDIRHFGKYFGQAVMGVKILMARDYIPAFPPSANPTIPNQSNHAPSCCQLQDPFVSPIS